MIRKLITDKHLYTYDDKLEISNTKSEFFIFKDEDENEVILKVTQKKLISTDDFYREINTQLACESEYVVPILDYGYIEYNEESFFYIIMPRYYSDLCLYTDFSFKEKIFLIKYMICSLEYVHEHGIIHRDIKPDNFFFSHKGKLLLGDFGSAHFLHERIKSYDLKDKGTAFYMAPECYIDQVDTFQNDIYSLGLSIYYLITEDFPFFSPLGTYSDWENIHTNKTLSLIQLKEWEFINPFLQKLSAINPKDRYLSTSDALIDFEKLIHQIS